MVMLVCILGGIGTAGVPSGSLPVVALICAMVGVPPEGIGLILGVNHFLDMCRTTLNVTGDLAIAAMVSRGEPERRPKPRPWPTDVGRVSARRPACRTADGGSRPARALRPGRQRGPRMGQWRARPAAPRRGRLPRRLPLPARRP